VLLFGRRGRADTSRDFAGATASDLVPLRPGSSTSAGSVVVTAESSLRMSAVWACLRLRANLMSAFPLDVYRRVGGVHVEVPKPPVLVNPGGDAWPLNHWLYASEFDLGRAGNTFGMIRARDNAGRPSLIEPLALRSVSVFRKDGRKGYRVDGKEVDAADVWHEKRHPVPGLDVGLSPLAYAAYSIGEYLSIQEFALSWFGAGGPPRSHLRNTSKTLTSTEALEVKERHRAAVRSGEVFVTGSDWEMSMVAAEQTGMEWLEAKRYGIGDIARFLDVPGDMIDAPTAGSSITYANVTQRNLQFLIMSMGPAVLWREQALSTLTSAPRFVKLNTDALLRMDPEMRSRVIAQQITARVLAPSEGRELDNRPPFTDAQLAEFDRLFPQRAATAPTPAPTL
jgi:HK97 family phage portal protein